MLSRNKPCVPFTVYLDDSRALVSSLFDFLSIFDDTQHSGRRIDVLQFLRTVRTLGTLCWGSGAKQWAETGRTIWHPTSASRWPVIKWSMEQPGQRGILITVRALESCLHRLIMMIHSSHDTASSSSTKHISNEAKQSSTGPGQRLSFEEIQSFMKFWQLDRINLSMVDSGSKKKQTMVPVL